MKKTRKKLARVVKGTMILIDRVGNICLQPCCRLERRPFEPSIAGMQKSHCIERDTLYTTSYPGPALGTCN